MAIIAAWHRYHTHKESVCVVDCGTAMTIDGIAKSGQHLGGLILPGYAMMQEILANSTSDINTIRMTTPTLNFSNSTEQGVNSGCYLAMIATIDRVVTSMKNDHDGRVRCIITGGNAELVIKQLGEEFEYEPNLVLHGLALFSERA
jgi:type III pantothenate kinase